MDDAESAVAAVPEVLSLPTRVSWRDVQSHATGPMLIHALSDGATK